MESIQFRKIFSDEAKSHGFKSAFGGWFKESTECIVVVNLQKSHFGNYFEMNIKIYVQGMFGNYYTINKDLIKKDTGDIFTRQPAEYNELFNFDKPMEDEKRKEDVKQLFLEFLVPFTDKSLSKLGLKELAVKREIILLPGIKEQLE